MAGKLILLVSDEVEGDLGEIAMLDTAHEAERRVESLLEAGLDPKRIHIFAGRQAGVVITYRPVVRLMECDSGQGTRVRDDLEVQAESKPVAVEASAGQHPSAPNDGNSGALAAAHQSPVVRSGVEDVHDESGPVPTVANSHNDKPPAQGHFSDLFRSAYLD